MKIYQLTSENFDEGCGTFTYIISTSKNKKQLESVAKKLNDLYETNYQHYYVNNVDVKDSLTHDEIEQIIKQILEP